MTALLKSEGVILDPLAGAKRAIYGLLCLIALFSALLVVWSSFARLDITAQGIGRVIPATQVQQVQNLEGGIITEILVQEGDAVDLGSVVARISDVSLGATLREDQILYHATLATVARLEAALSGGDIAVPPDLAGSPDAAALIAENQAILALNRRNLDQGISIILISHNLEYIRRAADRIHVLHQGKSAGIIDAEEFDQDEIVKRMVGGLPAGEGGEQAADL